MPLKDIMKNTPPKKYFQGKTYIYLNFKSNERGFAVCNQKSYRSILNPCPSLWKLAQMKTVLFCFCFPFCRKLRMSGWSAQLQSYYFSSPPTYHPICLQGSAQDDPKEHNSLVQGQATFGLNSCIVDLTPALRKAILSTIFFLVGW